MNKTWNGHSCPLREAAVWDCAAGGDNGQECPFYEFIFLLFLIFLFLYGEAVKFRPSWVSDS